jgi:hypothetical protein
MTNIVETYEQGVRARAAKRLAQRQAKREQAQAALGNPSAMEIVTRYLTENHFDGLYADECGCQVGDLFPCRGDGGEQCQAGYLQHHHHPDDCEAVGFNVDCSCIGPHKPRGVK